jgi:riboflavin synthase
MFTGLIDDVGVVERVERTEAGRELRIRSRYTGLADGESVAVNGACLTVRESGPGGFSVAAIVTTLGRTTIGDWSAGRRVNLERAMKLGDRLGGHLVQGHVDDVGVVEDARRLEDAILIDIRLPAELEALMVPHGSIEFTWRHTTLGELRAGDRVHLEADMVGKYVRQLVAPYAAGDR